MIDMVGLVMFASKGNDPDAKSSKSLQQAAADCGIDARDMTPREVRAAYHPHALYADQFDVELEKYLVACGV